MRVKATPKDNKRAMNAHAYVCQLTARARSLFTLSPAECGRSERRFTFVQKDVTLHRDRIIRTPPPTFVSFIIVTPSQSSQKQINESFSLLISYHLNNTIGVDSLFPKTTNKTAQDTLVARAHAHRRSDQTAADPSVVTYTGT
jgi:hypothetical protein